MVNIDKANFLRLLLHSLLLFSNMEKFKDLLSTRTQNGLSRSLGTQVLDQPEIIMAIGITGLRLIKGLGPKSLEEIALSLNRLGYISDAAKWLGINIPMLHENEEFESKGKIYDPI